MSNRDYIGRVFARYILNRDRWIRNGDIDLLQAHLNEIERLLNDIDRSDA
jgi:hypothetical protein